MNLTPNTQTSRRRRIKDLVRLLTISLISLPSWFLHGSPLKLDEDVIFFPTSANQNNRGEWEVAVHAWVFELEENSLSRKLGRETIGEVLECFDVTEDQTNSDVFRQRLKWFLVDNERNKRLTLSFGKQKKTTPRTSANGHVDFLTTLNNKPDNSWIGYSVETDANDARLFSGESQLVPTTGLSVISDIDDTIKISEVLDKEALIQNIFFRKYKASPGMPAFFKTLSEQGAFFHYVSASPWQLYPSLQPFMELHYPRGSYSLRHFRITDSSFIKFFLSSQDYKTETIRNIIQRYPLHQFILVGDSGEKDPEVYARIYAEFPENIQQILIRKVAGSDLSDDRLLNVTNNIPKAKWTLFDRPDEIHLKQGEIEKLSLL